MFTIFVLLLYRVGNVITVPFVNAKEMADYFNGQLSNTILGLYNAMSGNAMKQADGSAPSIEMSYVVSHGAEEYEKSLNYINDLDNPPYYLEELAPYIAVLNDATPSFEDLAAFASNFSLEDVITRHGA